MTSWVEFNLHDRATMRVDAGAPTAALLREMFEPFLARGLERYDVTVTGSFEDVAEVSRAEHEYAYTDSSLYIAGMKVQILLNAQGFRVNGTRELLTAVLPLVDRVMVTRDAAMIHAMTVEYAGHGICMPAWGGVGKTSTIAKLLRLDGWAFMGDDWAFLTGDGEMLGYAKPMFIKPHHRPIYPHIFAQKRKPLVPSRLSRPIAKLTTVVHPFVTQYPALAGISRRWSPEHVMVTPRQAFPDADISTTAPLAMLVFVERYDGSNPILEEKSTAWMVSRLLGNFHSEMALHSRELVTALGATGLVSLERGFGEKAAVLARAVADKPSFLLRVPTSFSADRASDVIVDHLHKAMADAGI